MRGLSDDGVVDFLQFMGPDPDGVMTRWRVNLTFLMSGWECIYGRGCPGHFGITDRYMTPDLGCCTDGFYVRDEIDRRNIERRIKQLTRADWDKDLRADVKANGWSEVPDPDDNPEEEKSRVVDGGCVFANRAGGSAGKPGCAFIALANRLGENVDDATVDGHDSHTNYMPEVCHQLPLKIYWADPSPDDPLQLAEITAWDASRWSEGDLNKDHDDWMMWWCCAEGTLITTERGLVPIQDVTEEDRVLTRVGFRQVLRVWDNGYRPVVETVYEGGTITTTYDHELLTVEDGWRKAATLTSATDAVVSAGSDPGVLRGHQMPLGTGVVGFPPERMGAVGVLIGSDRLHVSDVHADGVTAQVVDGVVVGQFTNKQDVDSDVGTQVPSVLDALGIPLIDRTLVGDAVPGVDVIGSNELSDGFSLLALHTTDGVVGDGDTAVGTGLFVHGSKIHHQQDAGVQHVYDLTVEGQHEYVANGVVVHNCVDAPEAYKNKVPVYIRMKDTLVSNMGEESYSMMCAIIDRKKPKPDPMAAATINGGRPLLPLIVGGRESKRPYPPFDKALKKMTKENKK